MLPRLVGGLSGPADSSQRSRVPARVLVVVAAAALLALLPYGVLTQPADTTIDDALSRGEAIPAPAFELDVLSGPGAGAEGQAAAAFAGAARDGRVALEELRGRPVVLNVWASWCEPCREEAPLLQGAWSRADGPGVLFLGADVRDATRDARAFIEEFALTYPNVRDPEGQVLTDFGLSGLPETFFISADGDIVGHVIGALSARQLAQGVEAAVSGEPVPAGTGGERRPAG